MASYTNESIWVEVNKLLVEIDVPSKLAGFDNMVDLICLYVKNQQYEEKHLCMGIRYFLDEDGYETEDQIRTVMAYLVNRTEKLVGKDKLNEIFPGPHHTPKDFCIQCAEIVRKRLNAAPGE